MQSDNFLLLSENLEALIQHNKKKIILVCMSNIRIEGFWVCITLVYEMENKRMGSLHRDGSLKMVVVSVYKELQGAGRCGAEVSHLCCFLREYCIFF